MPPPTITNFEVGTLLSPDAQLTPFWIGEDMRTKEPRALRHVGSRARCLLAVHQRIRTRASTNGKRRRSLRACATTREDAESGAPRGIFDHAVKHVGGEALGRRMHAESSADIADACGHVSRRACQAFRPPDGAGIEYPISFFAEIDHAVVIMIFLDERVGARRSE